MTSSQEAPALIQYACERCKTRFVLPPSSRHLSVAGRFRAVSTAFGRMFRFHEGLGAGYDTARRQLLAKMDDEAYQSFVQSFRFCHECRQFVCNECWSNSRRSCLTCVAKSMTGTARPRPPFAPTGPDIPRPIVSSAPLRRGRLRRDVTFVALAVAVVLLVLEGGVLLAAVTSPGPTPLIIYTSAPSVTASPLPSATEIATVVPLPTESATPLASPSAVPTASPTPSLTATPAPVITPVPTPLPVITPAPTAPPAATTPPTPQIHCDSEQLSRGAGQTDNCHWDNPWAGGSPSWQINPDGYGWSTTAMPIATWNNLGDGTGPYGVRLVVSRGGVDYPSNVITVLVTP